MPRSWGCWQPKRCAIGWRKRSGRRKHWWTSPPVAPRTGGLRHQWHTHRDASSSAESTPGLSHPWHSAPASTASGHASSKNDDLTQSAQPIASMGSVESDIRRRGESGKEPAGGMDGGGFAGSGIDRLLRRAVPLLSERLRLRGSRHRMVYARSAAAGYHAAGIYDEGRGFAAGRRRNRGYAGRSRLSVGRNEPTSDRSTTAATAAGSTTAGSTTAATAAGSTTAGSTTAGSTTAAAAIANRR